MGYYLSGSTATAFFNKELETVRKLRIDQAIQLFNSVLKVCNYDDKRDTVYILDGVAEARKCSDALGTIFDEVGSAMQKLVRDDPCNNLRGAIREASLPDKEILQSIVTKRTEVSRIAAAVAKSTGENKAEGLYVLNTFDWGLIMAKRGLPIFTLKPKNEGESRILRSILAKLKEALANMALNIKQIISLEEGIIQLTIELSKLPEQQQEQPRVVAEEKPVQFPFAHHPWSTIPDAPEWVIELIYSPDRNKVEHIGRITAGLLVFSVREELGLNNIGKMSEVKTVGKTIQYAQQEFDRVALYGQGTYVKTFALFYPIEMSRVKNTCLKLGLGSPLERALTKEKLEGAGCLFVDMVIDLPICDVGWISPAPEDELRLTESCIPRLWDMAPREADVRIERVIDRNKPSVTGSPVLVVRYPRGNKKNAEEIIHTGCPYDCRI